MPNEQGRAPWMRTDVNSGIVVFDLPNNVAIVVKSAGNRDATDSSVRRTAQLVESMPEILLAARDLGGDIHPMHGPDDPCIYCDAVAKALRKVDR